MIKIINNYQNAIIILHEIYGVNRFIEDICSDYHTQGFDVYCPDMLQGNCFPYSKVSWAYDYFINRKGFDFYKEIEQLLSMLKTIPSSDDA